MISFSIIIPLFNNSAWICRCIDSVRNQDFSDYELIIIDDGSTDSSYDVAFNYIQNMPDSFIFKKKNEGQLKAREFGIKKAKNDYCIFLDSDDCLGPNALRVLYKEIMASKSDMVVFGIERLDKYGRTIEFWTEDNGRYITSEKSEVYTKILMDQRYNSMCRKAIKRTLLDNVNVDYRLKYGEDLLQTVITVANCNVFSFIPDMLYKYYVNEASVTQNIDYSKNVNDISFVSAYLENMIYNNKINVSPVEHENISKIIGKNLLTAIYGVSRSDNTYNKKKQIIESIKETEYYIGYMKFIRFDAFRDRVEFFLLEKDAVFLVIIIECIFARIKWIYNSLLINKRL